MIATETMLHRTAHPRGASSSPIERELGELCADAARSLLCEFERAENQLSAKRVLAAATCFRARINACGLMGIAADRGEKLAVSEVAVALTISERIAQNYIDIGRALTERLPVVRLAFESGDLDYRRVYAIWRSTADVDGELINRVEAEILSAAQSFPPGRLALEIDRLLIAADPAQAALRRRHHEAQRNIRTGRSGNGMGFLEGHLTADEIAAVETFITELADTVCPRDPRDGQQLRADAFVALIHGEAALACRCRRPDCPAAGADPASGRRRPHLIVSVDLATLLGLADDPAVLAGFGVIDPDLARQLASDATYQLTAEDRKRLERLWGEGVPALPNAGDEHDDCGSDEADDCTETDDDAEPMDPDFEEFVLREYARQQESKRDEPPRLLLGRPRPTRTRLGPVFGDASLIATIEAAIAAHPELIRAHFPDGHGGHAEPLPGALTYRPPAAIARKVRARDGTCRHPGCAVPAARCQLDHIVPFDHADPRRGGWTIESNLHCLCKRHHDLKTWRLWQVSVLPGFAEHWRSVTGQTAITLPSGFRTTLHPPDPLPTVPNEPRMRRRRTDTCPSDDDEPPPF